MSSDIDAAVDLAHIWDESASAEPSARNGTGGLHLRWVHDAIAQPPRERENVVDGFMRKGELVVIGAPRAIGKSQLGMNLALQLERGDGLFLGALPVRRKARTLIAQGELDEWGSYERWQRLTAGSGRPAGVAESFDRWRLRIVKRRSSGSDPDTGSWSDEWYDAVLDGRVEHTLAANNFDVFIIDPWAVYYAGNENSNDEAEAALDKLRDLAMRLDIAVVILHHLGKSTDAREPEDLWRGASRLADWASTRVTILPHYTDKQASDIGMTRRQARRYVDVHFLRRSTPTDDFSMVLNHDSGWWERWHAPEEAADARRIHLNPPDVADLCTKAGGDWPSQRKAAQDLGCSPSSAAPLLARAVAAGLLEEYPAARGATGYRLPTDRLLDPDEPTE